MNSNFKRSTRSILQKHPSDENLRMSDTEIELTKHTDVNLLQNQQLATMSRASRRIDKKLIVGGEAQNITVQKSRQIVMKETLY
jgi:hypothetical protein